ncbi:MAG TPA: EAL domain-containing protein [Acidimicrobiia bacterium]|nr:EAL domain-containing protein [Acidimicrobiia bacterium]
MASPEAPATVWSRLADPATSAEPVFVLEVTRRREVRRYRYVAVNEAYVERLARVESITDVVGHTPADLLPQEFAAMAVERYDRVVATRTALTYEVGFEFADRAPVEYEVVLEPVLDADGRCSHIVGLARERSGPADEVALRQTERRFAALVQHSSDMVAVLDAHAHVLYASPAVTRVLGWPSGIPATSDGGGINAFDFLHPDDRIPILESMAPGTENDRYDNRREFRLRRADGTWCWVEAVGTDRLDDPAVRGVVVNARDISERKAAHEALRASQERFRSLVQHASEFVLVYGADSRITYASPAVGRFVGCDASALSGTERSDLLHPDDQERFVAGLASLAESGGRTGSFLARFRRHDGEYRSLEVVATNLLDNPSVAGVVVNARDVTDRMQAEGALRESEERFRSAFEFAPIGMALADQSGRIVRCNEALTQMLGRSSADLTSLTIRDITHPDDWADNDNQIHRLFAGELRGYKLEKRYLHADGHAIWASVSVSGVRDANGVTRYMIGQIEDITERKAIGERLVHQAIHDPLTGLPNRLLFMDRLRDLMARGQRRKHRVAVLFVDLDHFKVINDSLGHEAGDQLLLAVGHRLRRMLRPTDTVARFGGDEFTILCPDVDDPESVTRLAERVLDEIARPVWLVDGEVFATASIGIACSLQRSDAPESPETLVRDADAAMYRAKELGRRRVEFFDQRLRARTVEHLHIGNDLHRALERGEFELHYQPILELEMGRVSGFEALCRWRHPDRGLTGPVDFIGLAEETGLIVPLGAWVLETACAQLAAWQAERPDDDHPLTVSANVSPRQLAEPSFPDQIRDVIHQSGVRPGSLWLEITETALMHDTESATSALRALRGLGVHLAVDDFGTGYSSLSHLKRFPIEALKIDQSFIRGLNRDGEDAAIVTAVVSLAHALGLTSTAEGVETPEQLADLRTLGCEYAQGNLFAEPMPASMVSALTLQPWANLNRA